MKEELEKLKENLKKPNSFYDNWLDTLKRKIANELECSEDELIEVSSYSCTAEGMCFSPAPDERNDKIIFEAMIFEVITKHHYGAAAIDNNYFNNLIKKDFDEYTVKLDSPWGPAYLVLEAYPWLIMKAPYNFNEYYYEEDSKSKEV
jgi:hypothetical protein